MLRPVSRTSSALGRDLGLSNNTFFPTGKGNSPAIIFIDEIDAIATKRFDAQTGVDREVQRILLELLSQMDGFDQGGNVKVRNLSSIRRVLLTEYR